jgi:hypothetical protein
MAVMERQFSIAGYVLLPDRDARTAASLPAEWTWDGRMAEAEVANAA